MWKPVVGYEGYYEVNEDGIVRGVMRRITRSDGVVQIRQSKVLTESVDADGYHWVKLSRDGCTKRIPVHRIVARAYVDGYFDGAEVNHIDCDRANNNYQNLEWVTHRDNIAYTKSLERHVSDGDITGENNPNWQNHTLRDRFQNEPGLRMVQSRPGKQNGRARAVQITLPSGECLRFSFLRECAEYLVDNKIITHAGKEWVATSLRKAAESDKPYHDIQVKLI